MKESKKEEDSFSYILYTGFFSLYTITVTTTNVYGGSRKRTHTYTDDWQRLKEKE
jgi:hypothetical protein